MGGMDGKTFLILLLALVAVVSSAGVVLVGHAIRSALCLVVNFFCLAFLYFTLNAELLGIVQIVVYTGAIMVLFLFVVMLLAVGGSNALQESRDLKRLIALPLGLCICMAIVAQVALPLQSIHEGFISKEIGTPDSIGRVLFTHYAWPFEVASVLLLIGIVGSILLAKRKS